MKLGMGAHSPSGSSSAMDPKPLGKSIFSIMGEPTVLDECGMKT